MSSKMRKLIDSVQMTELLCVESTADGPNAFITDSEETLEKISYIEQSTFDEAEHWGGIREIEDEDYDSDPEEYDIMKENAPRINTETVNALYQKCMDDDSEGLLEDLEVEYQEMMEGN